MVFLPTGIEAHFIRASHIFLWSFFFDTIFETRDFSTIVTTFSLDDVVVDADNEI